MSLRDEISALAFELEQENNSCYDLWTWLPSYEQETKEHGDYATNYKPTNNEIIQEATDYIINLKKELDTIKNVNNNN